MNLKMMYIACFSSFQGGDEIKLIQYEKRQN